MLFTELLVLCKSTQYNCMACALAQMITKTPEAKYSE